VTKGLVEVLANESATYYPYDELQVSADAQSVIKGTSNSVGYVDPAYGSAGIAVTAGTAVRMWLKPAAAYAQG
jgi:hypothetical protein